MRWPSPRRGRARLLATVGLLALLAGACGGGGGGAAVPDAPAADDSLIAVAVASFDLHVADDARLLAGLYTPERQLLVHGEVTFQLGYLGETPGGATELTEQATARFLPVPGMEPEGESDRPVLLESSSAAGVYEARVDLDRAGFWGLRVLAELDDGRVLEGQATFPVQEAPQVPAPGDEAPRSVNLTLDDVSAGRARPVSLDSRAQDDATPVDEIPDPHLHTHTVAGSLEAGRPVLVVVATPVYCVSRFCGPLTEVVSELALRYEDRVDTVHIEVWEDFQEQRLNPAAAAWIQTETGGNEPWVFLVGADGRVDARWDNVLDVDELVTRLEALPAG